MGVGPMRLCLIHGQRTMEVQLVADDVTFMSGSEDATGTLVTGEVELVAHHGAPWRRTDPRQVAPDH